MHRLDIADCVTLVPVFVTWRVTAVGRTNALGPTSPSKASKNAVSKVTIMFPPYLLWLNIYSTKTSSPIHYRPHTGWYWLCGGIWWTGSRWHSWHWIRYIWCCTHQLPNVSFSYKIERFSPFM